MPENQLSLLVTERSLDRFTQVFGQLESSTVSQFFLRRIARVASEYLGRSSTFLLSENNGTLAVASALGLNAIEKSSSGGFNDSVRQSCADLFALGATKILVLSANLPLITPSDLRDIVASGSPQNVVICPDQEKSRTNALLLPSRVDFAFDFGSNSYRAHRQAARQCGFVPLEHFNSRLAYQVATPEAWVQYLNVWHDQHSAKLK